jgi:hypothetical protein
MNIKNAVGFFFLGLVMYVTPTLVPAMAAHAENITGESVRTIWLELMGGVIGAIGSSYLLRDAALRMPTLLSALLPVRMLNPAGREREAVQIPVGVRAVVSS